MVLTKNHPTPWVALRGLTREAGHWGEFAPQLRDALAPHGLYTPDLPGNGRRWRDTSPTRVPALVDAVRAQLLGEGLKPPYRLFGMSLGAMVCVAWADAHPHEVEACVLLNTSLRGVNPVYQRLRPQAWPALARLAWTGLAAEATERIVFDATSNTQDLDLRRATLRAWLALRAEHSVSRANALRQLLAAARFRVPAERPRVPVLLLGSRGDRLVSPQCSEALAARWHCDFAQHTDAGHDLPLDDGAWVVRQLVAWQARVLQRA